MPPSSQENLSHPDQEVSAALPPRAERNVPVILGIDPGTLVVGYGAVAETAAGPKLVAAGELRQPSSLSVPERLAGLRADLDELLERLEPDVVVVEQAFASKNIQSALRIGEGRGVVLASAAAIGAEVTQLAPASAKRRVVGNGAADKAQVAKMVATILGVKEIPGTLDVSDALALALAHVFEAGQKGQLNPERGDRSVESV